MKDKNNWITQGIRISCNTKEVCMPSPRTAMIQKQEHIILNAVRGERERERKREREREREKKRKKERKKERKKTTTKQNKPKNKTKQKAKKQNNSRIITKSNNNIKTKWKIIKRQEKYIQWNKLPPYL
jgi:hypothetical protein